MIPETLPKKVRLDPYNYRTSSNSTEVVPETKSVAMFGVSPSRWPHTGFFINRLQYGGGQKYIGSPNGWCL